MRSSASLGTRTGVSSPARNSRASWTASYRSYFRWTPGFVGMSDGAITSQGSPPARQRAMENITRAAGFVARLNRPAVRESGEVSAEPGEIIGNRVDSRRGGSLGGQHGDRNRILVHIHPDVDIG